MSYEIEYEFEIPTYIIRDIIENYNSSISFEEIISKNELLLKRVLLDYIINKYLYNEIQYIDENLYNEMIKNMKIEIRKKYFYVKLTI
ncbi:MAG: hypothetical protein ACP5GJ_02250 [Nanopusillaceae archaeon]|jgi:hypothetical protein